MLHVTIIKLSTKSVVKCKGKQHYVQLQLVHEMGEETGRSKNSGLGKTVLKEKNRTG